MESLPPPLRAQLNTRPYEIKSACHLFRVASSGQDIPKYERWEDIFFVGRGGGRLTSSPSRTQLENWHTNQRRVLYIKNKKSNPEAFFIATANVKKEGG